MPYLSIIVPVYKVEHLLKACLDSILAQHFDDFELILVNDGSPDNSPQICEEYSKKDSRIKVVHKKNGGSISARNAGIKIAKGKYIGFVDSDDWIEKEMYEEMCTMAKNYDSDIVICDIAHHYKESVLRRLQPIKPGLYNKEQLIDTLYPKMLYSGNFYSFGLHPAMCNKIYKRNLMSSEMLELDESITIGEDVAFTCKMLLKAESVFILEKKFFYNYRQVSTSITNRYEKNFWLGVTELFRHLKLVADENKHYAPNFNKQCYVYLAYLVIAVFKNEIKFENKKSDFEKKLFLKHILKNKEVKKALFLAKKENGHTLKEKLLLALLTEKKISLLLFLFFYLKVIKKLSN